MKKIPRYDSCDNEDAAGAWCHWAEVAALQEELNEVRAQALAAVWLVPEGWTPQNLQAMRKEACEVFMGRDKQTIAKLQDEIAKMREEYSSVALPQPPGVNAIYGVNTKYSEVANIRHALMITKLNHAPNGGLEIEVQLPP